MEVILQFLEGGCDLESVGHWSEMGEKAWAKAQDRTAQGKADLRRFACYS